MMLSSFLGCSLPSVSRLAKASANNVKVLSGLTQPVQHGVDRGPRPDLYGPRARADTTVRANDRSRRGRARPSAP